MKIFIVMITLLAAGFAYGETCDDHLLTQVDRVRSPEKNFSFFVQATTENESGVKLKVLVKDFNRSLVRYQEPVSAKGRTLLFVGKNMWVYVPGTRRALRISPRQQVLGGVASADIARLVFATDYHLEACKEIGETDSKTQGADLRLTLTPRPDGSGTYQRIDLEIERATARPRKAIFYAKKNRILKEAFYEDYQDTLGEMRPTLMRIIDHTDGMAETSLHYQNFAQNESPNNWFQPGFLTRLKPD